MTTPRFIPICCCCNNVRNDSERDGMDPGWGTLEAYLNHHHLTSGDYRLTHTYCPSCSVRFSKLSRAHAAIPRAPQTDLCEDLGKEDVGLDRQMI